MKLNAKHRIPYRQADIIPQTAGSNSFVPGNAVAGKTPPTPNAGSLLAVSRTSGRQEDEHALNALRGAIIEKSEGATEEIKAWVLRLENRVDRRDPFTVLEHTAFRYLLESEFFSATPERRDVTDVLERALRVSWQQHTGSVPNDVRARLPRTVLMKADRRARLYHSASFLPIGDRDAQMKASRGNFVNGFVPELQDLFMMAAVTFAGACSSVALEVLASAALSYAVIGLSECLQHDHLAHPRPSRVGHWILRGPKKDASWVERGVHRVIHKALGKRLEFTRVSHSVVHHHLTFKESYTQRFSSPEHKAKVDAFISKLDEEDAARLFEELYGTKLSSDGMASIMLSIAPQTAGLIAAAMAFGASAWAYVPIILIAGLYPFTMHKVHPFLHHDEHESRKQVGPIMKRILDSRWAAWACRNHWLHHQEQANYNLSFPGADALMGTLLQPNLEDLLLMAEEGTLHY